MKILSINRGSSSIKCSLYEFCEFPTSFVAPIWEHKIEWKNVGDPDAIKKQFEKLFKDKKIDCIGHRVVHGGKKYQESVLIDSQVKKEIKKLGLLAPLHNLADLEGIEILEKFFVNVPQVAVFDTAFHHTLPSYATVYPGPYRWVSEGMQRYGFHGISFQYCTRRAGEILGKTESKMVICHLGSGASLCAVKEGKSIDTTMGFTPLEGLMMDTRSGSIDPGLLLYLAKTMGVEELSKELYEKSGLLGLSGVSSDMRDVLEHASKGDKKAQLAIDVYVHRLTSMIGSMVAALGGMDTLVFTAGIGENAALIREKVCAQLSFLGISLEKNPSHSSQDLLLSSPSSKVKVLLIHTQEAFEIARECWKIQNLNTRN
jgi:acetate kinase